MLTLPVLECVVKKKIKTITHLADGPIEEAIQGLYPKTLCTGLKMGTFGVLSYNISLPSSTITHTFTHPCIIGLHIFVSFLRLFTYYPVVYYLE